MFRIKRFGLGKRFVAPGAWKANLAAAAVLIITLIAIALADPSTDPAKIAIPGVLLTLGVGTVGRSIFSRPAGDDPEDAQ